MSHLEEEDKILFGSETDEKEAKIGPDINSFGEDFSFVNQNGWRQRAIWFLCGICSLAAFNALINTYDYYQYIFPNYDVETSLTFPVTFAAIFGALSTHYFSKKFTLKSIILFCLIYQIFCMIFLPVIAYLLADSTLGFSVMVIILLSVGFINEVFATRIAGYSCAFHKYSPVYLSIGLSLSGVLYTLLRIAILAIFGDTSDSMSEFLTEIVVYSILASFFFMITIYCLVGTGLFPLMNAKMPQEIQGRNSLSEWWRIIKITKCNLFGTFMAGCIFYTVYAGATVQVLIWNLGESWSNEILILVSVISEVFGKYFGVFHLKGVIVNQIINCSRVLLIVAYYLRCNYIAFTSDICGIGLACVAGFSTTYFISVYWIKQVESVKKEDSQLAGFIMVIFMDCGLALGNLFQIILF
jgi:Nucleoside transporter